MQGITYKIKHIGRTLPTGVTKASACTMQAILKFNSNESPHCVYNEYVAIRLAQTLHIPAADGVLTVAGAGLAYASIEIGSIGLDIPNLTAPRIKKVVSEYPEHCAALLAFDLFIGNWDRKQNIKASLKQPHIKIFCGFDHSHALLNIEEDPTTSIKRLSSGELIVRHHPFYQKLWAADLWPWVERITHLPTCYIEEACQQQVFSSSVSELLQAELAAALVHRQQKMRQIIEGNRNVILGNML
ncbi:MAG: hypothetical protein U0Y68_13495 [Blastocatellia bacterium]